MPNIRSQHGIDGIHDAIEVIGGNVNIPPIRYTKADIEAYLLTHDIAKTEAQVNNYLANLIKPDQVRIHIEQVSPLKVNIITANHDYQIPDNWWVT